MKQQSKFVKKGGKGIIQLPTLSNQLITSQDQSWLNFVKPKVKPNWSPSHFSSKLRPLNFRINLSVCQPESQESESEQKISSQVIEMIPQMQELKFTIVIKLLPFQPELNKKRQARNHVLTLLPQMSLPFEDDRTDQRKKDAKHFALFQRQMPQDNIKGTKSSFKKHEQNVEINRIRNLVSNFSQDKPIAPQEKCVKKVKFY